MRLVDLRTRRDRRPEVPDIRRDADHRHPGTTGAAHFQPAADRILARPLLTRERGVHHHHRRRFARIGGAKVTTGDNSNTHRLEVARRDHLVSCTWLLPGWRLRAALDEKPGGEVVAANWQRHRCTCTR